MQQCCACSHGCNCLLTSLPLSWMPSTCLHPALHVEALRCDGAAALEQAVEDLRSAGASGHLVAKMCTACSGGVSQLGDRSHMRDISRSTDLGACREALFIRHLRAGAALMPCWRAYCLQARACVPSVARRRGAIGLAATSSVRRSRWPRARSSQPHSSKAAIHQWWPASQTLCASINTVDLVMERLAKHLFCLLRSSAAAGHTHTHTLHLDSVLRYVFQDVSEFAAICGRRCSEGGDLRLLPPGEDGIIHFHYD